MSGGPSLPDPVAEGDLARTPFAHLLLYIERHELNGTLVIWHAAADGERPKQDRVRFEAGEPVGGRLVQRASRLELGLLPIFARREGQYAFYEGVDLVGEGPEAQVGSIDPQALLAASLRGSVRDDAVDAVLERFGDAPVRMAGEVDRDRLGLMPDERVFLDVLRAEPAPVARLISMSALPPRMAERLLYLLAITKSLEPWEKPATSPVPPKPPSVRPSPRPPAPEAPPPRAREELVAPPPPEGLSADHLALWQEIAQRTRDIEHENYFQMLAVARDAPISAVQKAYFTAVKKWHPDRVPPELAPLRPFVERVFRYLTRASETLGDEAERGPYIASVQDGGGTPEADRKMGMIVQAALDYRKIEIMIKRRELDQALTAVDEVLAVTDEEADYHAARGWIVWQRTPADPRAQKDALASIDRALELNVKHDKAHFYRGMILKRMGRDEEALTHLTQAAELNPKNIDAVREVRLANIRKGGASGTGNESQSSILSKLFGGKKKE